MTKTPFSVKKNRSVASVTDKAAQAKDASENFAEERLVGMTFNMPKSWHTEFKMRSIQDGVTMHELLRQCFDAYKREKQ